MFNRLYLQNEIHCIPSKLTGKYQKKDFQDDFPVVDWLLSDDAPEHQKIARQANTF